MRDLLRLSVLCMAMAIGAVATAHHGTSLYDMDQEIVLKGTVAEWRWSNPHAWLKIEVRDADGRLEEWNIEAAPLGWLERNGWSPATLTQGESISIRLSPLKAGKQSGILREVTQANGETLVIRRPQWAN